MLMVFPIGIYFLTSIVVVIFDRAKLKIGYPWFFALGGATLAWLSLLFSYFRIPLELATPFWQFGRYINDIPALRLDKVSWSYAAAIATLALAVLLTDAARTRWFKPTDWAYSLALTGFGLLAIFSQNPMVLLPAWAALDFIETWILLNLVGSSPHRERVVVVFSIRIAGLVFLLLAVLRAHYRGLALTFDAVPPEVGGYLILAAGMRLGILPPHQAFLEEPHLSRSLGTIVRMIPITSTLVLLTRTAEVGAPTAWTPYLVAASIIAALYGSSAWARSKNELDGRPYWILGMAALAFIAAVYKQPDASLAWGLGLVFSGSVLFLMSYRVPKLLFPGLLGLWGISALPFSPTWGGMAVYQSIPWYLYIPFLLTQILFVFGYIRFSRRAPEPDYHLEAWAWVIYPLGLTIVPLMHIWVGWITSSNTLPEHAMISPIWWGSMLVIGLAVLAIRFLPQRFPLHPQVSSALQDFLSLDWLYKIFWWSYRAIGKLLSSISLILEGEGGVLWALLILILLISVMVQNRIGG